ncbi:sugar transferase [Pedobacter boryungensis]|uniref:Sugar transferase n=1 Tax=Pedobacter boryungensis TaxID=869962 RepID=A0ABX2DFI4_9SPHI|nr:sugar transferase [Pedobacter boryungensis]NQX32725.1 sugar transferase [Pedobacter boryungensis]
MLYSIVKRFFDFVFSSMAFVVLLPVFLIISILLFFVNKGNPLFFQLRPGKNGKIFKIFKFKTMTDQRDKNGMLLPDEARLTAVGKFVRKTSIDEIPQLLNVIKGEMSLIGPRPLLPEYLALYSDEQHRRHEVKPGITGWAQVNGRNAISWKQKFEYDVWYVDHVNFWLDLKIIGLTIKKILIREGISSATSLTMEKFKGN